MEVNLNITDNYKILNLNNGLEKYGLTKSFKNKFVDEKAIKAAEVLVEGNDTPVEINFTATKQKKDGFIAAIGRFFRTIFTLNLYKGAEFKKVNKDVLDQLVKQFADKLIIKTGATENNEVKIADENLTKATAEIKAKKLEIRNAKKANTEIKTLKEALKELEGAEKKAEATLKKAKKTAKAALKAFEKLAKAIAKESCATGFEPAKKPEEQPQEQPQVQTQEKPVEQV